MHRRLATKGGSEKWSGEKASGTRGRGGKV